MSTYSHTALGGTPGYSASALIGGALGKLQRDGLLVRVLRKSTDYWSYNGQLNTYALSRGPTEDATTDPGAQMTNAAAAAAVLLARRRP